MKKETFLSVLTLALGGCCSMQRETAFLGSGIELESLKGEQPASRPAPKKNLFSNPADKTRFHIVDDGKKLLGTPYRYGGSNARSGFDCSGLVQHVFARQGFRLPRSSSAQFHALLPVREPKLGDLVFFHRGNGNINHVGIYLGDQRMLHAPSPGKTVEITRIDQGYWKKRYVGARTVIHERTTVSR